MKSAAMVVVLPEVHPAVTQEWGPAVTQDEADAIASNLDPDGRWDHVNVWWVWNPHLGCKRPLLRPVVIWSRLN